MQKKNRKVQFNWPEQTTTTQIGSYCGQTHIAKTSGMSKSQRTKRMAMKSLACLSTTISVTLFAVTVSGVELRGIVTDKNGSPLPGVSVVTEISGRGTTSDMDGRYTIESGRATRLTFSSVGYQPAQFSVSDLPDTVKMTVLFHETEGIIVTADRAKNGVDAVAYANVSSDDIARDYSVGELPLLLASTPNAQIYTDGGAPLGYSYLKIRGFNDQRIATYINGVPLNDPEDQFTYFVDLPDFGSNITDIQVQRGVGNSLYGDASFGGSINIATNVFAGKQYARLTTGYGEFTHNGSFFGRQISKQSVEFSSGLVDGQWAYYGRFSRQSTSGYRDNSWYNGWAYYLAVGRLDPRMSTELHVYGGPIRTHLSFFGVERATLEANRLSNPLTYANETDNFNQPHYQLQNSFFINDKTTLSNTFYYIRGKGFFEQFKDNRTYSDYNLAPFTDSATGDLVRRKWVEKNQIGWNPRLDINYDKGQHTLGGSVYLFNSDHWGQVISAEYLSRSVNPSHRYYEYFGNKVVASLYATEKYRAGDQLTIQATAQLRYSRFNLDQVKEGAFLGHEFTVDWLFFSPRLGVSYSFAPGTNIYANVALSSRAPNDDNVYDADNPDAYPLLDVKSNSGDTLFSFGDPTNGSERAYDIEAGFNKRSRKYAYAVNLFYLLYDNEYLFDFGADALDSTTTLNIPRSFHSGIELSGSAKPLKTLALSGSFSYNFNRIVDFTNNLGTGSVNFDKKTLPGFPEYLGNFIVDLTPGNWRLTGRGQLAGKQYMEPGNLSAFVIDPYFSSSLSASYRLDKFTTVGALTISGTINNLFDNKYIVSGYGGNFLDSGGGLQGWAQYFVSPERSFWGQVALDL